MSEVVIFNWHCCTYKTAIKQLSCLKWDFPSVFLTYNVIEKMIMPTTATRASFHLFRWSIVQPHRHNKTKDLNNELVSSHIAQKPQYNVKRNSKGINEQINDNTAIIVADYFY